MRLNAIGGTLGQFVRAARHMGLLYVASTGLSFLVGIILAHLLGPNGLGTYALALTAATLAGLVTEFGLPTTAMRETGFAMATGDWGAVKGLLRWADRIVIGLSLAIATGFVAVYLVHGDTPFLRAALWGALLIPLVAVGKLRALTLLALGATYAGQGPQMILRPLSVVLGSALVWWMTGNLTPSAAMAAQVAGALVAMLWSMIALRRCMPAGYGIADPVYRRREWLSVCMPLGVSEGLRLLQGQESLVLVGSLAGTAAAGFYRVADAVMQISLLATSTVGTAGTPMFARLHAEGDTAGLQRLATICTWTMVTGTFLLGLPVIVFGRWLIPFAFGHDFAASLPLFRLLWAGAMLAAATGPAFAIANMTGRHIISTQSLVLVVLANAALALLLIPRIGVLGGAIATAVATLFGALWSNIRLRRLLGIESGIWAR